MTATKLRPVDDQLAFEFNDPDDWEGDRRILTRIADAITRQVCALDLDMGTSRLAHELAEDDRNLPACRLRYFLPRGPRILTRRLVARWAGLVDARLVELAPVSPEQENDDIKWALDEMGPEIKRIVLAKAARRRR